MSTSLRARFVLALACAGISFLGFDGLGAGEKDKGVKDKGPEILATLKGHTELVYSVAFSADNKYVATGSFDNTVKLWEAATGKELKTFGGPAGHQKMVVSVAISPDGQFIASGSGDNTLKVWDVPMNSPLRNLAASEAVGAVALTADGTKLAVGSKDGLVKLVNAADFKDLFKMEGHQGAVTGLTFSPNGQILISCGADRTVRFWNVANGQNIAVVGAHTAPVNAVAINPAGYQAFSVGDDGLLKIWSVPPTGTKPLPGHGAPILAMALSGDGNQVVTAGADKVVRQTLTAGKEVRALTGPNAPVTSVALNPANTLIAAGTADEKLFLWNAADGKPVTQTPAHAGAVTAVNFHPQNNQLATGGADGLIKLWAMPPVPPRVLGHPDAVQTAVFANNKIITGGADKILRVWDAAKLAVERQFTGHPGPISAVAISANGQILVSGGVDGSIRFWNQAMGKEAETVFGHAGAVTALGVNPAGTQLLSASEDGSVKIWQIPVAGPKGMVHPDQVTAMALTGDGAKLVTGGFDKQAHLWNLANGQKEKDYAGPTLPITSVDLSSDGKIAAGSADKTVHVWAIGDAKLLQKVPLPAAVQAIAFSPDGKTLAAGLTDNAIKLINPADGKEIKALAGHKGAVNALAYTPKGDLLWSASADKTIQSWAMPDGAPKAKFDHVGPVTHLALSKDGTRLAAAADKSVKVWNLADGKELATINTPAEARGVGFSPDNARVVIAGGDKLARIYEIGGQLVESFPHDGPVHAVRFIDAKRVISASADKQARVWTSSLVWQKAHQGAVRQAFFSPKGDQIFSAGDDKTVRIWNAGDGKDIRTIAAHDGPVAGMSLSADGARLATTAADKTVKIWNLTAKAGSPEENKPAVAFALPAAAQSVTLSPNGQRIALGIGEQGNLIRVYDIALGREIQALAEHAGPIKALQFLPDNRTLLTASADKNAKLLDVGVLAAFEAHKDGVVAAQYHNNGTQLLTAGGDKTVKLWDLTKNAVVKTFGPLPDGIKSATFNRDFTQVGVAAGKNIKVWNIADGKDVLNIVHPADVHSLSFSVDKTKIATGAVDKLARVFDAATGKELQSFPQDEAVASVIVMPANTSLVAAGGKTPRLETLALARVIVADAGPTTAVAVNPPGTHVLTAGADKTVKMWNISNGNNERSFTGATAPLTSVTISKNNLLVAAASADQAIRVFNINDAKELGAIRPGAPVKTLSFTPNNLILVAACGDKTIQAWSANFTAGQPLPPDFLGAVQKFTAPEATLDLAAAPDNATIYTGNANKSVYAWKLASPAPVRNFPHPNLVDAVAFQPGGPLIATGCHDGKIRLFDNVKNAPVKEINAHPAPNPNTVSAVYALAFSADGKQLASASADQSLKLWDVASGNLVREFKAYKVKDFEKGHQEPVFALALSPDGKLLASGSGGLERIIKIWNTADGAVVRELANPNIKASPGYPAPSHPGWVYKMRWSNDGKYLVSVGDAPGNKGFLAIWDPNDGKMLYGEMMPLGNFFGLSLSPDGRTVALGAGPRGRPTPEFNSAYLIRMPIALPK
ncbi:MAG: hypothetical protein HY040_25255 [Planctomycetes bacterium]|nr:hypothetical protein [Planctomycetota bacterium]